MLRRLPEMLDLDLNLPRPPFWLVAAIMIAVVLSWVPLAVIVWARMTTSDQPRYYPIQDMAKGPGYRTQQVNPIFRDGRAMRPAVPGTVAWGADSREPDPDAARVDDHYYRGYQLERDPESGEWAVAWYESIPLRIEVDDRFLERGRQRYDIYCYTCHGKAGDGRGPINQRALEIADGQRTIWTPASNLHAANEEGELTFGPERYPDGRLFSVISDGIRAMPGYAKQISVEDRWAIVAYVRALQESQREMD